MSVGEPLTLILEFARADSASDPFTSQFSTQDYLLRSGDGNYDTASLSWNQALLSDLQAVRLPLRDPARVARLGEVLRQLLRTTDFAARESEILSAAQQGRPISITIRSAAAELYVLPWELLTLRSTGQHLGELPSLSLRYEWPKGANSTTSSAPAAPPRLDGERILLAWSAAAGAVPASEHLHALRRASQDGFHSFVIERDVLPHASMPKLLAALQEASSQGPPISVLHLLCHGAAIGSTFGLALDDDASAGEVAFVDAGRLRQLLSPYAAMLRLVVLSTCDGGNSGALGNQLGSMAQTLHRGGIAQVLASRYPLSLSGSCQLTETFYEQLLVKLSSVESALRETRRRLAMDPSHFDWASLQLYTRTADAEERPILFRPYRGLLSFGPEHRRFFFGRERETREIVSQLRSLRAEKRPRLLAVDGVSGSGKSSVVLAGALRELRLLHETDTPLVVIQPGSDPLQALEKLPSAQPALLIIDQFEELFTHTPSDAEGRRRRSDFARRLWQLATAETPDVSVVLTIRSDFVGRCGELVLDESGLRLDRILYTPGHRISIAQLGPRELRAAIEGPALAVGLSLESGLAERMLADVEAEPAALPLLADTLDALWLRRRRSTLTQDSYDALGGIAGTLTRRADPLIDALGADGELARKLFLRLITIDEETGQRLRHRQKLADLRPQGEGGARFDAVLQRLLQARLLVLGRQAGAETGQDILEVAHEALLRRWPRLNRWLAENRGRLVELRRLETWAREFVEHGTLLRGHQLGAALEMQLVQDERATLPEAVRQLLDKSQQFFEEEEERARQARDSRRIPAAQLIAYDPARVVALLREVESKDPLRLPGWLAQVTTILHCEVLTCGELRGLGGSVARAIFNADRSRIATGLSNGLVQLWDAATGQPLATHPTVRGTLLDLSFTNEEGHLAAVSLAEGQLQITLLDLEKGIATSLPPIRHRTTGCAAVFSPDGQTLASAGQDGELLLTTLSAPSEPQCLAPGSRGRVQARALVSALSFSADGRRLAAATQGGKLSLFELRGGHLLHEMKLGEMDDSGDDAELAPPTAIALAPSGSHLAVGCGDGRMMVLRTDGKGAALELPSHDYRVNSMRWSPDGALLSTTSDDGYTGLFGLLSPSRPSWLRGHRGEIKYAAFSHDGARLLTASSDCTVRSWDLIREQLDAPVRLPARKPLPKDFSRCLWRDAENRYQQRRLEARSADGSYTASADARGHVTVSHHGKVSATWTLQSGPATALALSPDGGKLAVATSDNLIHIVEPESGRELCALSGHSDKCYVLCFSPDGRLVASAAVDWTVRLWRAARGEPVASLAHDGAATWVQFTGDGQRVITACEGNGLWLWELDGSRLPLIDPEREDYCVAVRNDAGACITENGSGDSDEEDGNERYLWPLDLDPTSLIARLWRATPICLSIAERRQLLGETTETAERNHRLSLERLRTAPPPPPRPPLPHFRIPVSWDGPADQE